MIGILIFTSPTDLADPPADGRFYLSALKAVPFRVFVQFREHTTSQWLLVQGRYRLAQAEYIIKRPHHRWQLTRPAPLCMPVVP
jgi:hypothetical protein